jgi:RNA polymerase sigma factor (TIGR02999 family)
MFMPVGPGVVTAPERKAMMNATAAMPTGTTNGHAPGADTLFGSLYAELHRLARHHVHRQGHAGGLGATTLLHESYLSISGKKGPVFPDRARFLGYAARVMRGLIIDDVRRWRSDKRGGQFAFTSLLTEHADSVMHPSALLVIGEALDQLATIDSGLAEIVDLKFFCGFSFAEIAGMKDVSERTVQRNWEKARLYLHHVIASTGPVDSRLHAANQP